jgi:hypothetical protein
MKVIFLDNDGVICLYSNWGSRLKKQRAIPGYDDIAPWHRPVAARFDNFDQKAIAVLNSLLAESGAEIVVSSDWRRKADLEEISEYYLEQGISKAPIGFTPLMRDLKYPLDFPHSRNDELEQQRSLEILHWLGEHPEVTHWVAVDDLDMADAVRTYSRGWGLSNFVWTPLDTEGIKQTGKAQKILEFLGVTDA